MATATLNNDRCCPMPTTSSFSSDNSRVKFLKQRFSDIINKAQLVLAGNQQSIPTKKENENKKKGVQKSARNTLKKRDFETTVNNEKQSKTWFSKDVNGMKRRRMNEEEEKLERQKKMRKIEIERMRAAARKEIDEIRNDTGLCDPQEVTRDFARLVGCNTAMGRTIWSNTGSFMHQKEPGFEKAISTQGFISLEHCFKDGLVEVEEGEITDRDW